MAKKEKLSPGKSKLNRSDDHTAKKSRDKTLSDKRKSDVSPKKTAKSAGPVSVNETESVVSSTARPPVRVSIPAPDAKTKSSKPADKMIYYFAQGEAEGEGTMRDLLGGKGAGLASMAKADIPVPPGFTITTEVCNLFYENRMRLPKPLPSELKSYIARIEKGIGRKFGGVDKPLLVSVRSGAKFSMPGMMDTILNLGLNDKTLQGLIHETDNPRFAYDSYRRFIQMFSSVVLGIDKDVFEEVIEKRKVARRVKKDASLSVDDLKEIVSEYKKIVKKHIREPFPDDPWTQLTLAIEAVFKSWNNPRAIAYRKMNDIPSDLGTAVNVQAMVFGNTGEESATGVGFTRNPSTGEKEFYGEFLTNAQGEDVVAGIRTPRPLVELAGIMKDAYRQLKEITTRLEQHYREVQDFEFTIQDGHLWMLQTRTGKRTAQAGVKFAVDMVKEKLITREEALQIGRASCRERV